MSRDLDVPLTGCSHVDPIDPVVGRAAREWADLVASLPTVPEPWPPTGPIVVVAPHPDDELLAVGATLAGASDAGAEVRVVAVTDGEMSHPHLTVDRRNQLTDRRLDETVQAYELAGIRAERIRLSLPDGGASGLGAKSWENGLTVGLAPILDGATTCLAPWVDDGHPDHDACGRVARTLCTETGVALVEFPVWSWNWDNPAAPSIPFNRSVRFDFDKDLFERKQAGISAYSSQIRPEDGNRAVLPSRFLAHFARPAEVFLLSGGPLS